MVSAKCEDIVSKRSHRGHIAIRHDDRDIAGSCGVMRLFYLSLSVTRLAATQANEKTSHQARDIDRLHGVFLVLNGAYNRLLTKVREIFAQRTRKALTVQ